MVDKAEDVAKFKDFKAPEAKKPAAAPAPAAAAAAAPAAPSPTLAAAPAPAAAQGPSIIVLFKVRIANRP